MNELIENENGEIWKCRDHYRVYIKNRKLSKYIEEWNDSLRVAEYYYPDGNVYFDYRIPCIKLKDAMMLLGLEV